MAHWVGFPHAESNARRRRSSWAGPYSPRSAGSITRVSTPYANLWHRYLLLLRLLGGLVDGAQALHQRRVGVVQGGVPGVHVGGAAVLLVQLQQGLLQGRGMPLLYC